MYKIFQPFGDRIVYAVFTRRHNIADPRTIQEALQTAAMPVSFLEQLHGDKVTIIKNATDENANLTGDALVTNQSHIPLVIRIADCASIIIFDPVKNVIANIHAGWRGLAKGIIRNTIRAMKDSFGSRPENLCSAISPMIGPCCCRFSDPSRELPKFFKKYILEENTVDLWAAAEGQLRECGISQKQIENPRVCTYCHPEDYYSYRREGNAGRFGTAIMLL